MNAQDTVEEAVDVLQDLGLKEYEARCFVGLTRLDTGTAKKLSEITEVPRTRVYDAVRVLEAQGLVEVQHSSPQEFRAVTLEEATETLKDQYENRVERLKNSLNATEAVEKREESPVQRVWAISGRDAVENRTNRLIDDVEDEIVLVLGDESLLTDDLVRALKAADKETELIVAALTQSLQDRIDQAVPRATTFVTDLGWLHGEDATGEVAIGRLLLVDRSTILVSTILPDTGGEQAVFGEGFGNGLVVIARRLMAHGLVTARDPGEGAA